MKKETIIHIIDSLKIGGAEILLMNTINLLLQYEHLIIYLHGPRELKSRFNDNVEFVCIDHEHWSQFLISCSKIKKIVTQRKPLLVHSHLQISTLLARFAVPKTIPLVSTIHSVYSIDAFHNNKKALMAERLSVKKRQTLIAVSDFALQDYLRYVPFKGRTFILYNFLPDYFFENRGKMPQHNPCLRCIAVGNLKEAKNYHYLLSVMERVKDQDLSLDIYGEGLLKKGLQKVIDEKQLKVHLRGMVGDMPASFSAYDLFIQASEHEGFGLSVIEAIASKLPVFISDIPVFREVTNNHAHFLPLDDSDKAAAILHSLIKDAELRKFYIEKAYNMAKEKYSQTVYYNRLSKIYGLAGNEKIN